MEGCTWGGGVSYIVLEEHRNALICGKVSYEVLVIVCGKRNIILICMELSQINRHWRIRELKKSAHILILHRIIIRLNIDE